jgi:peptidyl-prolyl cis-trans isomerase SurA
MRICKAIFGILLCASMGATIIDRIAIVVRDRIIKDSDIDRDIRVVDFLNQEKLSFGEAARRSAANRLIDQAIILREIQVGEYRGPTDQEAEHLLEQTQSERHQTPAQFVRTLDQYGLTRDQLRQYLKWQLTVLRFIDDRFRPGILVTDQELEEYYRDHTSEFRTTAGGQAKSLEEARDDIRNTITEQRINQQFDAWIQARRKATAIQYREESLK